DAARLADNKWETIFGELIPRAQRGVAAILGLPDPATIAFAPNTHDFVRRLISALPAGATPRPLTSDSAIPFLTRPIARPPGGRLRRRRPHRRGTVRELCRALRHRRAPRRP